MARFNNLAFAAAATAIASSVTSVAGQIPAGASGPWALVNNTFLCTYDPFNERRTKPCPRYLTVYGSGGMALGSTTAGMRWATVNETHDVTFCGTHAGPSSWDDPRREYVANGVEVYCPVYAERDESGTGGCQFDKTFAESQAQAAARNSHICNVNELVFACGRGTGCQHDRDMIWSETLDPTCWTAAEGGPDPCRTPIATPPPTPANACDAYRVVSGSSGDQTSSPLNTNAGATTRHELTCCSDVAVTGWQNCAGNRVWAERNGPEFLAARMALGYLKNGTEFGMGDTEAAGGAFLWEADGCVHNVDWEQAAQICNAIVVNTTTDRRARLCTPTEMISTASTLGCGANTGCAHNNDAVWSNARATNVSSSCVVPGHGTSGFPITASPTSAPSPPPSFPPTGVPTTLAPTNQPTVSPTEQPTGMPTTGTPTTATPTDAPTDMPTTATPTSVPTTAMPTFMPTTSAPTMLPTGGDSSESSSDDMTSGSMFIIWVIVAAVVVIVAAVLIIFYRKSNNDDGELAVNGGSGKTNAAKAFDNPMYDTGDAGALTTDNYLEVNDSSNTNEFDNGFDNDDV